VMSSGCDSGEQAALFAYIINHFCVLAVSFRDLQGVGTLLFIVATYGVLGLSSYQTQHEMQRITTSDPGSEAQDSSKSTSEFV